MTERGDPQALVGRRFGAHLLVLAVADDAEQTVTMALHGDTFQLSYDELMTMIECGFLIEIPTGGV